MPDPYATLLWDELGAWHELQEAVRVQRAAIVQRRLDAVWTTQDALQDLLGRLAVLQERQRETRPLEPDGELRALEHRVGALRRQAREGLRLNHELLRDICSYLDMMREVVLLPRQCPTYGDPRHGHVRTSEAGHSLSRTA
ncbi:MAG: hypothetical protein HPY69_16265 [Armatimonadetes bacterium]|nr:hypothetical protein [Armatimonadota bacterium]